MASVSSRRLSLITRLSSSLPPTSVLSCVSIAPRAAGPTVIAVVVGVAVVARIVVAVASFNILEVVVPMSLLPVVLPTSLLMSFGTAPSLRCYSVLLP